MPLLRLPRAIGAQAISRAMRDAGNKSMEHVAVATAQTPALDLALAFVIEDAKKDRVRMMRENGDACAAVHHAHAKMRRARRVRGAAFFKV